MISNDITISLNELFKYFDTVNVSGFRRATLERDKQSCQGKKRKRISKCSVFSTLYKF